MIPFRAIGIIAIAAVLGAGAFLAQPQSSVKTLDVLSGEPKADALTQELENKMSLFVGRATSENLQEQVVEIQDLSLLPSREPCSGEQATAWSCYDTLYTDIVNTEGIEPAFAFLRKEYQTNAYAKAQCHQITHIIGRAAERKFSFVSEAYGAGDGFCWSGYYHGVIEAVIADIGSVNLEAQLNDICADIASQRTYSFDHYNCVHGLGHGIMALTQNELFESLETCDVLKEHWDASSCWSGAFMENIMADNRNHFTAYVKKEEPLYPCTAVDERYKGTCYLMQTSYMLTLNGYDFAKTFSWCEGADEGFENICYQSLGRDASGSTVSNAEKAKNICLLGKDFGQQSNCVIGAVKDFISYHHGDKEALFLCSLFEPNLQEVCISTAKEYVKVL